MRVLSILIILCFASNVSAQSSAVGSDLTLSEVIAIAQEQSPQALIAKHNFRAYYWQFRSYKAKLLPSLNLNGNLGNFNRSLLPLQNTETGEINYISNHNLRNSLSLSVDQNIALTGGKISLYTNLRYSYYESKCR